MNARAVLATLATLAALTVIGAATRVPWTWSDDGRAVLRLSWRAPALRVEECRPLTEEEKADLPVHMRRDSTCVGRAVDVELTAGIDGRTMIADTIAGSDEVGDRRVAVSREIRIEPGVHRVSVSFQPIGQVGEPVRFEETLDLGPRGIVVVTLDEGALVARTPE